jgi:hypothetical protein
MSVVDRMLESSTPAGLPINCSNSNHKRLQSRIDATAYAFEPAAGNSTVAADDSMPWPVEV